VLLLLLVNSIILPLVAFWDVAYIDLSSSNTFNKLQSILNATARLIGGTPKLAHTCMPGFTRESGLTLSHFTGSLISRI